jgi:hypothetical protein
VKRNPRYHGLRRGTSSACRGALLHARG